MHLNRQAVKSKKPTKEKTQNLGSINEQGTTNVSRKRAASSAHHTSQPNEATVIPKPAPLTRQRSSSFSDLTQGIPYQVTSMMTIFSWVYQTRAHGSGKRRSLCLSISDPIFCSVRRLLFILHLMSFRVANPFFCPPNPLSNSTGNPFLMQPTGIFFFIFIFFHFHFFLHFWVFSFSVFFIFFSCLHRNSISSFFSYK